MGVEVRNRIPRNEYDYYCDKWMTAWYWVFLVGCAIWLFGFTPFHPFHFVAMLALAFISYGGAIIIGGICGAIHIHINDKIKAKRQEKNLQNVQLTNFVKGCRNGRN